MARKTKEKSRRKKGSQQASSERTRTRIDQPEEQLSTADAIRAIAAYNARADLADDNQLLLFLKSWWSRVYNRPLKDPMLLSYSMEELLYEFYDRIERQSAAEERSKQEDDKIDTEKEKSNLDWAEKEELREQMASKRKKRNSKKLEQPQSVDPTKDPANIKWMQEQLDKAKEIHGETFGEDVDISFE